MDFIRSITNNETLILNEDYDNLLSEIEREDITQLNNTVEDEMPNVNVNEDALDRVVNRAKNRDIAFYRSIVGTSNLLLTKKFLELAEDGKGISSPIVKGYYPAIEMIDDIVKAGPAYVELLKALHARAKKKH